MAQKIGGGLAKGLAMKFDEVKFTCAINGNEEIPPAFRRLHLGNVNVQEADGAGFELLLRGQIALEIGKSADPMPLQAPMQR